MLRKTIIVLVWKSHDIFENLQEVHEIRKVDKYTSKITRLFNDGSYVTAQKNFCASNIHLTLPK